MHKFARRAAALGGVALFSLWIGSVRNPLLHELQRKFPSCVARFEKEYGKFRSPPGLEFDDWTLRGGYAEDNTVTVSSNPTLYILYRLPGFFGANAKTLEAVVYHELAHLYVDDLVGGQKQAQNIWVFQGVADYMQKKLYGHERFYFNFIFDNNYRFVKPVLDKLGVEKGVRNLAESPPTKEEREKPPSYYKRIGM